MPGRRLTGGDRQRIAAGLAQGLDLAEIARQLGRPTSTVSREIARNGGPGRYRADLAQLATTHRARRRPRPAASPRGRHPGLDPGAASAIERRPGLDPEITSAIARDLAVALVETGVPRTAAGIMACLYVSESGSRTASELAQQLQVSPATVSHAVALLEEQGLLLRGRDGRSRRQRYFIDGDAVTRTVEVSARANQRLADTARRGAAAFGTDTAVAARLAGMASFLEHIGGDLVRSAERWRAATGAQPS